MTTEQTNTDFAKSLELSRAEIATLARLTPKELKAIRRNVRVETDQDAIDAAAQYMADGGDVADLMA